MDKQKTRINETTVYVAEREDGYMILPCASCEYEQEDIEGEHCDACYKGEENNYRRA